MNAYVLICTATRQSVLIDPGADPDTLQKLLNNTQPKAILITHTHPDHIGALDVMKKRLNIPVKAHSGNEGFNSPVRADQWLKHGDVLSVGRHELIVYHVPGHTQDMVCYAVRDDPTIVVGDTLFDGGPGKTWSVEGFRQTRKALRDIVLKWPDESICYPGHGAPFCLGDKRAEIEKFLEKDHGDFFGDAQWGM